MKLLQETLHACVPSHWAGKVKWSPGLQFHRPLRSTGKGIRDPQEGFLSPDCCFFLRKWMPGFMSDQKSFKSAQKAVAVSPVNFTPTDPVLEQKQKPQSRDLKSHGYHEPLTRGKIFWVCEVGKTAANVSVWKPRGELALCRWHTEGCCTCLEEPLAPESGDAELQLLKSKEKVNASFAFCKAFDKHYLSAWE